MSRHSVCLLFSLILKIFMNHSFGMGSVEINTEANKIWVLMLELSTEDILTTFQLAKNNFELFSV